MTEHPQVYDADGSAALGICESLLLALTEGKIISEKDARDLLVDVVTSTRKPPMLLKPLRGTGL